VPTSGPRAAKGTTGRVRGSCAPGAPSALAFSGLPDRAPYGATTRFRVVASGDGGLALVGPIRVRMTVEGETVGRFEDVAPSTALVVRLEPGQKALTVQARFAQAEAPGGLTCAHSIAVRVLGVSRIVLPPLCGAGAYRPPTVVLHCGERNLELRHLKWRHWNRPTATARGVLAHGACLSCTGGAFRPYASGGLGRSYTVHVRAYRVRRCGSDHGRYRYTRLRISYAGQRPRGAARNQVQRIACSPVRGGS
jgi:hypothetical protein